MAAVGARSDCATSTDGLGVHPLPAMLSAAQYGIIALSVFALVAVGGAIIDIAENVQAVAKQQLGAEQGESD